MTQQEKNICISEIKKDFTKLLQLKLDLENKLKEEQHKQTQTTMKEALNVLNYVITFNFKKLALQQLKVTTHGGKMEGINSLSTYKHTCNTCLKYSCISGAICSKCYAEETLKQYKQLNYALLYNSLILKYSYLQNTNILRLNCQYFRFESFSDLQNEIHLHNIIRIVKANKQVNFALWSKNYALLYNYIKNNKMPNNMNIILSSLFLNIELAKKRDLFIKTGNIKENKIKVFTVYDKETIKEKSININCLKKCNKCLKCYKKNSKYNFISEKLK